MTDPEDLDDIIETKKEEKSMDQDVALDTLFSDESDEESIAMALSSLIEELASDDNISMFSDLTMREIRLIAVIDTLDSDVLDRFSKRYKKLKISGGRLGRKELIDVSESLGDLHTEEQEKGLRSKVRNLL